MLISMNILLENNFIVSIQEYFPFKSGIHWRGDYRNEGNFWEGGYGLSREIHG